MSYKNNILDLPDKSLITILTTKRAVSKKIEPSGFTTLVPEEDIEDAIKHYRERYVEPFHSLEISPSEDSLYIKSRAYDIAENLLVGYLRGYTKYRKEIKEAYQKTRDWNKVLVYEGAEEAFIDEVEAVYSVEVKDDEQLSKLTGIALKGDNESLEDILNIARYARYNRALQIILKNGGNYPDLLKVEPKDYGLPDTWEGTLGKDKATSISWAINNHYYLDEVGATLYPNYRLYATDLKAPFSVIMDAYFITKWRSNKKIDKATSMWEAVRKLVRNSLSDRAKEKIARMSKEELVEEGFTAIKPTIPKNPQAIEKAVDNFIKEELEAGLSWFLMHLGIVYDTWGFDAVTKEVGDQLKAEINYKDEGGELIILDSEEDVVAKVKKIILDQPVEVITQMGVFGRAVTEEEAKGHLRFRTETQPEIAVDAIYNHITGNVKDRSKEEIKENLKNFIKEYPKEYKALLTYARLKKSLSKDEVIDRIEKILM